MSREPRLLLRLVVPESPDPRKLEPSTHLAVTVYYQKGAHSGSFRGIVMSIYPVRQRDGMESMLLMSGLREAVEELKRDNAKRVAACRERLFADVEARRGEAWTLVLRVLAKEGVVLAPPEAAEAAPAPSDVGHGETAHLRAAES